MYLVLIRHGESTWNKENRFTGWTDVSLTEKGKEEAHDAGRRLNEKNIHFEFAYTSVLKRAIDTLTIMKEELQQDFEVIQDWHLNERHYGALQGLNKEATSKQYGEEKVFLWRRSFDVRPPLLTKEDERYPGKDDKYSFLSPQEIPLGESLEDTMTRTLPYYMEEIEPKLKKGHNVLLVAHGNSLRSIVKYLENIKDEEIPQLEIPYGVPWIYEFDASLHLLKKEVLEK